MNTEKLSTTSAIAMIAFNILCSLGGAYLAVDHRIAKMEVELKVLEATLKAKQLIVYAKEKL